MRNIEKAKIIDKLYEPRASQVSVSEKLGIPVRNVRITTITMGYYHGVRELKRLIMYEDEFEYLSKYPDKKFEQYKQM